MKIIHFANPGVGFWNTTLDWAIQGLPQAVLSYTYDSLRQRRFASCNDEVVLFLEAGQCQHKHGGLTLEEFKQLYPNSKVVIWSSDGIYYKVNDLPDQFNHKLADLVFDVMPQMVEYWREKGCMSECLPWTISRRLHKQLRQLAGEVDFIIKDIDFISLINANSYYRKDMIWRLTEAGYSFTQGGSGNNESDDLVLVYNNFLRSWINIETSSHNRPELTHLSCMKGFRAAAGIALNCLTAFDDTPNVSKVWDIPYRPTYDYTCFDDLINIRNYYKKRPYTYQDDLFTQQRWLQTHLLDDLLLSSMLKYNI